MAISSRQLSFSDKKLLLSRATRSAADYKVITSSQIFLRSHVLANSAQLLIIRWSYRCCQSKYKFVKFLIGRGSQTSKLNHYKTTTTNLCLAGYETLYNAPGVASFSSLSTWCPAKKGMRLLGGRRRRGGIKKRSGFHQKCSRASCSLGPQLQLLDSWSAHSQWDDGEMRERGGGEADKPKQQTATHIASLSPAHQCNYSRVYC